MILRAGSGPPAPDSDTRAVESADHFLCCPYLSVGSQPPPYWSFHRSRRPRKSHIVSGRCDRDGLVRHPADNSFHTNSLRSVSITGECLCLPELSLDFTAQSICCLMCRCQHSWIFEVTWMCAASLQQPTFLHNSLQYEYKDIARIFEHMVLLSCFKTSLSVFYCRPEVNSAQELSFLMSAVELLLCHIIQYNIISFLLL